MARTLCIFRKTVDKAKADITGTQKVFELKVNGDTLYAAASNRDQPRADYLSANYEADCEMFGSKRKAVGFQGKLREILSSTEATTKEGKALISKLSAILEEQRAKGKSDGDEDDAPVTTKERAEADKPQKEAKSAPPEVDSEAEEESDLQRRQRLGDEPEDEFEPEPEDESSEDPLF